MATKAAEFMVTHGIRSDGLVYFSLARNGEPYHFERKIFSACFLCLGCGTLYKVTQSEKMKTVALSLLTTIISLSRDPSPLGRPSLPGAPPTSPMNVPMILLNLIDELRHSGVIDESPTASAPEGSEAVDYLTIERWCISEILKHVVADKKMVLEVVGVNGEVLEGYEGRHMNPGHAIEAGWFVYQFALRTGDESLKQQAVDMIDWSFERGWDQERGGLYYFLDSEGFSPPYLEWDMKLWWPHCEAMVAYAMLYRHGRDPKHWERFVQVSQYTLSHFSDSQMWGEWFGYLNREGKPTHRFKGGPYKGCFHVPRALFLVTEELRAL